VSVGSIDASNRGLTTPALPQAKSGRPASGSVLSSIAAQHTAASLQGQIRAAREQLNDWVTCVSAMTPKGQAEIRSLSAQISAAQESINRLQPTPSGASLDVWA
jgi:hypothetical protein